VVFLDKDGTLVENIPYNVDPARMKLLPGAGEAAARLCAVGWRLAVVTNQSGVARGFFPEEALKGVELRLSELLQSHGAKLAAFHYCPHHPEGSIPEYTLTCLCRKPEPGMILTVCHELDVKPESCWMVGDELTDEAAGRRAECRTILVSNKFDCFPESFATSLEEAADFILLADN